MAEYSDDGRLWLAWAQMEARSGNVQLAREVFADGVEKDPDNIRLIHAWAVFEEKWGRIDEARVLLKRCLDLDPTDGIVWQGLALLEERDKNTEVARETFEQGVKMAPDNAYLWSAWGVLEQRHRQYARAAELFERAIDRNPQHVRTLQAWAITMESLGRPAESRQLFNRALAVSPRSVPTFQAYALFEARRGNLDAARHLFQTGSEIDPGHAPVWHAWAVMEQKEGRFEVARELFEKGVNAAPYNTPMLRAWASMELQLGHIDKSRDWMVPPGHRRKGQVGGQRKVFTGKRNVRQLTAVGENLKMLRLMIEGRSDEDVTAVMKWLDRRARADRKLYSALQQRRDSDVRKVSEWVERRSASDIASFKEWLGERYERDRRVGVYIFNWDIPPRTPTVSPAPAPVMVPVDDSRESGEKPVEWLMMAERPAKALQAFDEQLYTNDASVDYFEALYFMEHIAGGLVNRAALLLVLGAMSLALVGTSAHLFDKGYSPSGESTNVGNVVTLPASPPSGVDAHLYEADGAENITSASTRKARGD